MVMPFAYLYFLYIALGRPYHITALLPALLFSELSLVLAGFILFFFKASQV